jgi:Secretion system C-terminal sorting domain
MVMYYDTTGGGIPYFRDYTQGHLYKPLTAGKTYCVSFYTTVEQRSEFAINNIGAYFDDGSIDTAKDSANCAIPQTMYIPQILDTEIIEDTVGWSTMWEPYPVGDSFIYDRTWVKIQGTFVANGTERFITLGNFYDNAHTRRAVINSNPLGGGGVTGFYQTVYLIDDVSVMESDNVPFAGHDTTIGPGDSVFLGPHEIALPYIWYKLGDSVAIDSGGGIWVKPDSATTYVLEQNFCGIYTYDTVTVRIKGLGVSAVALTAWVDVYPNPAHDALTVEGAANYTAIISNLLGQELFRAAITSKKQLLDIAQLTTGTYLLQIVAGEGSRQSVLLQKD